MAETQKLIREELTSEQQARFEELMKQSRPAGQRKGDDRRNPIIVRANSAAHFHPAMLRHQTRLNPGRRKIRERIERL